MEEEVWKDIEGYEGRYQVSNLGNIKTLDRIVQESNGRRVHRKEKLLVKHIMYKGYERVKLYKTKDEKNTIFVHKLVASSFVLNPNNYTEINHIDGNKINNADSNLEWCSRSHNVRETYRLGLRNPNTYKGAGNKSSKLTEQDVLNIRQEYSISKVPIKQLAQKYNTCYSNINYIVNRITWSHI